MARGFLPPVWKDKKARKQVFLVRAPHPHLCLVNRQATVHEEAMLAVGALTYACGAQFSKYMQSFYPILEIGLQQHLVSLRPAECP